MLNEKYYSGRLKIIFLESYKEQKALQSKLNFNKSYFRKIYNERQYLNKLYINYFINVKNKKIYFFSRHYIGYSLGMIERLRLCNEVIYIPDSAADGLPTKNKFPTNFKDIIRLFIYKLIFSSKTSLITIEHEKTTFISNKHLNILTDRIIKRKNRDSRLKEINLMNFNLFPEKKYDVLYFGHNALNVRSSREDMEKTLEDVYNILLKHFPKEKIAYKLHPGRDNDLSMKFGDKIASYIPAEFLINNNVKIYITPYSSALSQVKNQLCISLIDLIPTQNERLKKYIKNRIKKMSVGKLHFPKTYTEFEMIIQKSIYV